MPPAKRPRASATAPAPSTSASGGKRVKFAPADLASGAGGTTAEEDDLLEDDLGAKKDKGDVVTEGYDSDSSAGSDGGFGVGGGRKGKTGAGATGGDDEDDDMFGGEEKEVVKEKGKGKEFLEMGDIEGQEFGKGEDGEEVRRGSEEEEEEEVEDYIADDDLANDDDAPRSRRSKKSMGYKLSSFNMADELAEGRFSADGSYVANADDPLATHDVWLDGVSKSSIKAARESKKRMEDEAKKREENEAKGEGQLAQERDDCLIGLLGIVREGETVARALARLGAAKKKKVVKRKVAPPKPQGDAMEIDDETALAAPPAAAPPTEEDPAAKKINLLTHLSSTLLAAHGELEIYEQTYDDIIATLKKEGAVRRDWVPPRDPDEAIELAQSKSDEQQLRANRSRGLIARPTGPVATATSAGTADPRKFWYKWVVTPAGQQVGQEYGPYGRAEVEGWIAGQFFGVDGAAISLNVDGTEGWKSWKEITA